jgi:hypothetical protein
VAEDEVERAQRQHTSTNHIIEKTEHNKSEQFEIEKPCCSKKKEKRMSVCALFLFCVALCGGVVVRKSLTPSENFFATVATFAYGSVENATYAISARPMSEDNMADSIRTNSTTNGFRVGYLLICDLATAETWTAAFSTRELACEFGLKFRSLCINSVVLFSASDAVLRGTLSPGVLPMNAAVVFQQCLNPPTFEFELTADLRNGDSHLDAEDVPMPRVFLVVASIYGVVVFCWFALWRFHGFRFVWVHTLLTVALVCKSVSLAVALWYWSAAAYSGDLGRTELLAVLFVDLIQRVTQHQFLFLLGKGFGITRRWLRTQEMRAIIFMTTALAGAMLAFDFDDRGTFSEIETVARLSTKAAGFVAAGVALKFVQIDMTHIIHELSQHLQMIGAASRRDPNNRVVARFALMKALRIVVMSYYTLFAVAHLVVVLSLNEVEWWERLMCECVEFLLFIALFVVLRPRSRATASGVVVRRRNSNRDGGAEQSGRKQFDDADDDNDTDSNGGDISDDDLRRDNENEETKEDMVVVQFPPNLEPISGTATWRMTPRIVVASVGDLQRRLQERKMRLLIEQNEADGDEQQ